jgi:hypothetical protein
MSYKKIIDYIFDIDEYNIYSTPNHNLEKGNESEPRASASDGKTISSMAI